MALSPTLKYDPNYGHICGSVYTCLYVNTHMYYVHICDSVHMCLCV